MEHVSGKRLLVTRALDDNGPWVERLISLGAEPVPFPCISIVPLELSAGWADALEASSWVAFTSHRSVQLFADLLGEGNLAAHQIAAVGPTTAAACVDRFGRCDLTSNDGTGKGLAEALAPKLTPGAVVLLPGAADPSPELAKKLEQGGSEPVPLPLYVTRPTAASVERVDFTRADLDAVLFASPSAVSGCFATANIPTDLPAACIGPTTTEAARAAGLTSISTSDSRDLDGLLIALQEPLTPKPQNR